ncbi:prolyl oligopeptidase family serine peptidase [Siphonobacter sp. SORGH_AS_0500]|uniref:S9 family peptidase n=1 Tax=Siphonobacter sp. SORGH_AS_0500 TaxID=1864824 RepID=UPI00285A71F6|nr:prolyl oligopeptidase family serine peptidase [Siphonobacter sp. SORGH_AS_0500]MDR6195377.1 dipeptidyl aminopeptidase/acylaminoacyl peptidase [Siphonobacter sp. SORGH_AS_0500]
MLTFLRLPKGLFLILFFLLKSGISSAQKFSLEAIKSYPFPNELTASAQGSKIAWALNEQGRRNVYVAEGPAFTARKLTDYTKDDGQEISSLAISADGKWVVYVRGGDHGSNWDSNVGVNVDHLPLPPRVEIWAVPFAGGVPKLLSEGDMPIISPKSDAVAFIKNGQAWSVSLTGSTPAKNLFNSRGGTYGLEWSPDGSKLVFVADRGDHSLIGVYTNPESPIQWIAPSFANDRTPRWSPDGSKIVFVRTPGTGGVPDSILVRKHRPWAIMVAEVASGKATQLWKAPKTLAGSIPTTNGGFNLHWAAKNRIVYLSYEDGWPHLYSIPATGGTPLLLTPGHFMVEHIRLSPNGQVLTFSANTGPDPLDIDRRHVAKVSVDQANMSLLAPGTGLEWTPVITGDHASIALISATAQRPPLPAVMPLTGNSLKLIGSSQLLPSFPQSALVTPKQVVFTTPDGFKVYGQLFEPAGNSSEKKPAIVYVHGGPQRQMLLGWHYSDYYANAYATNQYLASLGFVVLSVNYRLGIGYGYEFHQPERASTNGASEYIDIKAAGEWLAKQSFVDPSRIGIYGGSYGGYLTAMALGRDSKLFAAGVDIHGVHDRTADRSLLSRYEKAPDAERAAQTAWESSPIAYVNTWTSPVLIIHGDDDRNVRVNQSTDLIQRLEAKGVEMETMIIVNDTHHWMKHAHSLQAGRATAEYFQRKLKSNK